MAENSQTLESMNKDMLLTDQTWRRACGCIKTSDKLKQILMSFPVPPPPTPMCISLPKYKRPISSCISPCCPKHDPLPVITDEQEDNEYERERPKKCTDRTKEQRWKLIQGLVSLIQLSVTATALALYYLIYCYMQLVYFTLRSALYFHHADGPMKVTIGVMTITSLIVGFNLLLRMERLVGVGLLHSVTS